MIIWNWGPSMTFNDKMIQKCLWKIAFAWYLWLFSLQKCLWFHFCCIPGKSFVPYSVQSIWHLLVCTSIRVHSQVPSWKCLWMKNISAWCYLSTTTFLYCTHQTLFFSWWNLPFCTSEAGPGYLIRSHFTVIRFCYFTLINSRYHEWDKPQMFVKSFCFDFVDQMSYPYYCYKCYTHFIQTSDYSVLILSHRAKLRAKPSQNTCSSMMFCGKYMKISILDSCYLCLKSTALSLLCCRLPFSEPFLNDMSNVWD